MNKLILLITSTAILFAVGCSTSPDTGTGTLEVRMFDAPGDYQEVNVFVDRVEMNRSESDEGWQVVSEPGQQYDLLKLTNGDFEVIADAELETGTYQQIRLILGRDNNNVVIDGEEQSLTIPSGQETGVKLNVDATIEEGIRYVLLLDFNVNRSVVKTGETSSPGYILQPVIRATSEARSANIGGTVLPVESSALITAFIDETEVTSTYADSDTGSFLLVGLDDTESTYRLEIEPRTEGFEGTVNDGISITIGETENIGEIELASTSTEE